MASNASSRWFWNDWTGDLALKKCSRAAQGFWMALLAIAAAATPRGYIIVGDKPCTVGDLALLLGDRTKDINRWLRELEANGVFSRTEDGTMFCRRMVREDANRSQMKAKRKPNRSNKSPKQLELPETDSEKTPPLTQEEQSSSSTDSLSTSNLPSSPEAARAPPEPEDEKHENRNPQEAGSARLGDLVGRIGANMRMPAAMGPALCKGVSDAQTSQAPATDHGDLARERQDHPAPIVGEGQPAAVGPSPAEPPTGPNHGLAAARPSLAAVGSCRRIGKSPALRAKIRDQLVQKCARFLVDRRRPEELAAYWSAMLADDPAAAQRMLDAVDRRMRAARWDDMRQWKHQHGIAA